SLDKEGYVALRGPNRHIYRLHRQDLSHNLLTYPNTSCYRLVKGRTLEELTLEALPHVSLQPGQLEVTVKAAGLNFRDVLKAMDLNPWETTDVLGSDCAGIVSAIGPSVTTYQIGDEVMGFAEGSFATQVVSRVEWLLKKPTTWSFNEAATVPTVFLTVYYSLI